MYHNYWDVEFFNEFMYYFRSLWGIWGLGLVDLEFKCKQQHHSDSQRYGGKAFKIVTKQGLKKYIPCQVFFGNTKSLEEITESSQNTICKSAWPVFQKFSRDQWKITIFLEWKSWNWFFFQFFNSKSLLFWFKYEWQFSWGFFWGILRFCKSKIGDSKIFASDFFHFNLGHFGYLLRPKYEPQQPQWGLKF